MKKILLADDSITIQKVVELTFSDGNYQVVCVSNGAQALKKIRDARPDIVLLDVIMPEKSGYEVCEQIKSDPATASIPVLLLTGTFEPFDRRRADAAGASGHLTKPFESQALVARVEELISQASQPRPRTVQAVDPSPEHAAPAGDSGGSYLGFADLGLDEQETPAGDDSVPPAGSATMRVPRVDFASVPSPESPETSANEASAEQEGFMEGFVPGYEIPPGQIRAASRPEPRATQDPADSAWTDRPSAPSGVPEPETGSADLSPDALDRLAEMVVRKLSDRVVREIAWEVIPSVAEAIVRQRIKELEEGR